MSPDFARADSVSERSEYPPQGIIPPLGFSLNGVGTTPIPGVEGPSFKENVFIAFFPGKSTADFLKEIEQKADQSSKAEKDHEKYTGKGRAAGDGQIDSNLKQAITAAKGFLDDAIQAIGAAKTPYCRILASTTHTVASIALEGQVCESLSPIVEKLGGILVPELLLKPMIAQSVPHIGAVQVQNQFDQGGRLVTGAGVRVGVIDSGIDHTHPDLGGCVGENCKVFLARDFTGQSSNSDLAPDSHGHGTHIAGIIAANGVSTGIAPGALLANYRVCSGGLCSGNAILQAFEAAVDPNDDGDFADRLDIVNISLGGACGLAYTQNCGPEDVMSTAVNNLVVFDVIPVVAAGNFGNGLGVHSHIIPGTSIASPGTAADALTVGAVDLNDGLASFSSIGPLLGYEGISKPDLVAPGVNIYSARAADTCLGGGCASSDDLVRASGTSMATPHVVGVLALLKQVYPDLSATELMSLVRDSAQGLDTASHLVGAGRVDALHALEGMLLEAEYTASLEVLGDPILAPVQIVVSAEAPDLANAQLLVRPLGHSEAQVLWESSSSVVNQVAHAFDARELPVIMSFTLRMELSSGRVVERSQVIVPFEQSRFRVLGVGEHTPSNPDLATSRPQLFSLKNTLAVYGQVGRGLRYDVSIMQPSRPGYEGYSHHIPGMEGPSTDGLLLLFNPEHIGLQDGETFIRVDAVLPQIGLVNSVTLYFVLEDQDRFHFSYNRSSPGFLLTQFAPIRFNAPNSEDFGYITNRFIASSLEVEHFERISPAGVLLNQVRSPHNFLSGTDATAVYDLTGNGHDDLVLLGGRQLPGCCAMLQKRLVGYSSSGEILFDRAVDENTSRAANAVIAAELAIAPSFHDMPARIVVVYTTREQTEHDTFLHSHIIDVLTLSGESIEGFPKLVAREELDSNNPAQRRLVRGLAIGPLYHPTELSAVLSVGSGHSFPTDSLNINAAIFVSSIENSPSHLRRAIAFDRPIISAPALADLTGDGKLEIIVNTASIDFGSTAVQVRRANGQQVSGFPFELGPQQGSQNFWQPTIGALGPYQRPHILLSIGTAPELQDRGVVVLNAQGQEIRDASGARFATGEAVSSPPMVADLSGSGQNEIIVTVDRASFQFLLAYDFEQKRASKWSHVPMGLGTIQRALSSKAALSLVNIDGNPALLFPHLVDINFGRGLTFKALKTDGANIDLKNYWSTSGADQQRTGCYRCYSVAGLVAEIPRF